MRRSEQGVAIREDIESMVPQFAVPPELRPFMELILADPALQQRLGDIVEPEAFREEALAVASEHGLAVDEGVLQSLLDPDPLGLGRFGPAPVTMSSWPGPGWLPSCSVPVDGAPAFDWAWFGSRSIGDPFFQDSVFRATARPFNRMFRTRTSLDALTAGAADQPGVPLAGLVYHMSRCGSTLLAQMLGAVRTHLVISEPEPLDAVLLWAWRTQAPLEIAVPAVRAIVAALARPRGMDGGKCFIKLDSWHVLSMPLLRAAFPDIPWIYLFRDPLEVLVSHEDCPGMQAVAGVLPDTLFGIADGQSMPPLDYTARVLDAIGSAAIASGRLDGGLFVEYPDIAADASGRIAQHLHLDLDDRDRRAMAAAADRNSKSPGTAFEPDSARKRAEGSPAARVAARLLADTHRALLALAQRDNALPRTDKDLAGMRR